MNDKNLFKRFPLVLFTGVAVLLAACSSGEENQSVETNDKSLNVTLTQVWATDTTQLITPECATYDPGRDVFYISNLNRENDIENDGYISLVNSDGSIKEANWVEGLESPLGNDFYKGYLYVSDNGNIVKIDIEQGSISERISIESASDLNGIDIGEDGTIYVADSDGNKIFRVSQDGEAELIMEGEELNSPNGVFIKGNELLVASSDGNSLKSIDLDTGEIITLVEGLGHADGIIPLDEGQYLISSWTGEVYFIDENMNKQKILDTSDEEINAADIGYISEKKLMVVPTFYDNRLVAYQVDIN